MKKSFLIIDIILMCLIMVLDIVYISIGGLAIKATTSILFVTLGVVNLIYSRTQRIRSLYTIVLCVALFVAMIGDITININFNP